MDATWRLRHFPALDGLRGLAVLGVVAFHAGRLTGGYLGVDLFFVLSGFLITSLLLGEHRDQDGIRMGTFWGRRAKRLLPALLVVLVAVAAYAALLATPTEVARLRGDALGTLAYVANWRAVLSTDSYWAMFDAPSPLQHTWSLAIEEQFYVLWPLVVAGLLVWKRRSPKAVLAVSLGGVLVSFGLMVYFATTGADTNRAYYGTDTRIGAIFLGAALAAALHLWGHVRSPRSRLWVEIAALVGVAWLAFAWFTLPGESAFLYRGGFLLCELAVVALIATATHPDTGLVGRTLGWRPLCWIGLVSYGIYLWHWPVFVILDRNRLPLDGLPLLAVQLAITFAIAAASYYLLEMPIRRGTLSPRLARAAAPLAVALTAVVVVAATATVPPAVTSSDVAAALAVNAVGPSTTTVPPPDSAPGATGPGATSPPTTQPRPVRQAAREDLGRNPRVFIVGDSVAFTVAAGLTPYQEQLGVDLQNDALIACGVAHGDGRQLYADGTIATEGQPCQDWVSGWGAKIDAFQPDVALLVLGWPGHTAHFVEGEWRRPCDATFDRWYEDQLRAALDQLQAHVGRVALTTVPYYRSLRTPEGNDANVDCLNQMYRRVATDRDVALVDLAGYICPGGTCRVEDNDIAIRPDGLHFDGPSGTLVGAWLLDRAVEPLVRPASPG